MQYSPIIYIIRGLILVGFCAVIYFKNFSTNIEKTIPEAQALEEFSKAKDNESEKENLSICSICGNSFYGNGYEEQMDGRWVKLSEDYQGTICSPACGRESIEKLKMVTSKYGINTNEPSNIKCQRCRGYYENGFCNLCGGASPERVSQSNQYRENCEMCQGNKYVNGYNGIKRCPVCKGTGVKSY